MSSQTETYIDWGLLDYETAFAKQQEILRNRIEGSSGDTLIFTEHPAVYTIGSRIGAEKHLIWDDAKCSDENISVIRTNRGGDITYHGPGQIVGYPIIDLSEKKDLHAYLRDLEQVLINSLGFVGLAAGRRKDKTGIWLEDRKIAAMGVAVKRWVAYHGFSLNVNNELSHYEGIVPCGISLDDGAVTSVKKELGTEFDQEELKQIIAKEFWKVF